MNLAPLGVRIIGSPEQQDRRRDHLRTLDLMDERARRSLEHFVRATVHLDYKMGWVHQQICKELEQFLADVVAGKNPRLMLFAPPRHGKSELASRRFPAYALGRYPDLSIIATSYGAELASSMNRDVQRIIDSPIYENLYPSSRLWGDNIRTVADGSYLRNSDIFEIVGHRGVYKSSGVGGGITGRGMDIGVIDDPIKDAEQAYSQTYRDKVWEWYTSTFYTRLMPGGGILIILTRWHEDDLAGRILKQAAEDGEQWRIVSYPAIAEVDEEHRKMGEALHPERYSLEALERIKTAVGTRVWASLYQQRPAPLEGGLINLSWFKRYNEPPAKPIRILQSWDMGMKDKESNDPSVCTTWAETDTGFYLLDVWRKQAQYPEIKRMVVSLQQKWNASAVLVEDKASGTPILQDLQQQSKIALIPVEPKGDKVTRLLGVSAAIEGGRVFLPQHAPWLVDFEAEIATFPNSAHDDQVDSLSQALNYILRPSGGFGVFEYYRRRAEAAS